MGFGRGLVGEDFGEHFRLELESKVSRAVYPRLGFVKTAFAKWPLLIPARESVSPVAERTPPDAPSNLSSKNSLRVYWVLGLAVGDGVAAGCGAKLLLMSMTLSG